MLYVVPSSVEGKVADKLESKMLESPSVLDIDGYFVWGGSVVKGKDGRYHMLFSLWESGGNVNPKNDGSSFNVQISLIKK